jgi:hypothetical protein
MTETISLRLLHPDGTQSVALLSLGEDEEENCLIDYEHPVDGRRRFLGPDYFWALKELRNLLDPRGIKALCNGARKDAVCSNMASQMGRGLKIYVVEIGSQAKMNDLVQTFDQAAPEIVGTVQEQEDFQDRWIASLRSPQLSP